MQREMRASEPNRFSRRHLLGLLGSAAAASVFAACAPAEPPTPTPAPVKPAEKPVAAAPTATPVPAAPTPTLAPKPAAPGAVTVEMWAPHPLDDNIKIDGFVAKQFAPKHPNINFKFTRVPSEWEQKFRTAAAGKQLPDIFAVDGVNLPAYASRDLCAELEKVVPADVLKDYWPPAKAEMQWKGKTYAVVLETNSQAVRVNVDLVTKAGVKPPETWEQLVEVGQKLTIDKNGKHPNQSGFDANAVDQWAMETWCCKGEGSTWMITAWIWMNGGDIIDEATRKVQVDEAPAVEAIQFLHDLVDKHKVWPKAGVVQAGPEGTWYGQKVVLSWTGAYDLANLTVTRPPKFKWDIAPIPYPTKTGKSVSGVGGWLFSAWKESKNRDQTLQFIEFMTTPEWHEHVSEFGYALTGRMSVGEKRVEKVPQLRIFLDAMRTGKARPRSSEYPLITDALQQAFDETIFGTRPVKEALTDAKRKIEEAVAKEK